MKNTLKFLNPRNFTSIFLRQMKIPRKLTRLKASQSHVKCYVALRQHLYDKEKKRNNYENYPKVFEIRAAMGTMDGILDTVSAVHALPPLITLLKTNGKLILLGVPDKPLDLPVFPLIMGRKMIAGSGIGGMKETQEMLDFAAKHGIKADIEVIPIDYVNTAMERLARNDVKYRFVIDVGKTIKKA